MPPKDEGVNYLCSDVTLLSFNESMQDNCVLFKFVKLLTM